LCSSALNLSSGIAVKGVKLEWRGRRQLHSLFTCFSKFGLRGGGKGNNAAIAKEVVFFLNCLKRQKDRDVRRDIMLRRREKSDCCFRT